MIPYSTPLWTIFTKWPAPASPKWRQPSGGASTSRIGASRCDATPRGRRPSCSSRPRGPRRRRRCRRRRSGCRARVERGGAAHVVVPVRVAAVDDRVALVEQVGERVDRLLGRVARRAPSARPCAAARACATRSSSDEAPVAPWPSAALTASALKSNATTWWSESRWMRWTMLPPILPSPTNPSCIRGSPSRRAHGGRGRAPRSVCRSPSACARISVPKRVRLAGHLEVVGRVVDELEEAPGRRAALVELAGRVQVARAVAERGGHAVLGRSAARAARATAASVSSLYGR